MTQQKATKQEYWIMDGRVKIACPSDYPDDSAIVLDICDTIEEARQLKKEWPDSCIVDTLTGKLLWEEESG